MTTSGGEILVSEGGHLEIFKCGKLSQNLPQLTTELYIVALLHMDMFRPVKSTWIQDIVNNYFSLRPEINTDDISENPKPTVRVRFSSIIIIWSKIQFGLIL